MKFQATEENGNIKVKAIIEKKGKDLIIHVPSLILIHKLKKEFENDKRNIQQI
jgi:hypothetical protein